MTQKHTPGPWSVNPKDDQEVLGLDGGPIFNHYNDGVCGTDPDNARLIAAAPELLPFAELIASIPIREQFGDDLPVVGIDGVMILQGDVRAARAVIAKAKGETQ